MASKQNTKKEENLISQYFKSCNKTAIENGSTKKISSSRPTISVNNPKVKRQSKPKSVGAKCVQSKSDAIYLNIISNRERAALALPTEAGSECPGTSDPPIVAVSTDAEREVNFKVKYLDLQKKYSELEAENKKLLKDNKILKKLLNKAESVNMYKDHQLMERNVVSSTAMLFEKYEITFSSHHLKELRSIPGGKSQDSAFVNKIMACFYPGGVEQKCVAMKKGQQKGRTPITPDKLEIIDKMLKERIMSEKVPGNVVVERHSRLNTLIGYALTNLRRKSIPIEQTQNCSGLAQTNQFAFPNAVITVPAHYDQRNDHPFTHSTFSPVHTPTQNSQTFNWTIAPQNIGGQNFPYSPSAYVTPYTTDPYANALSAQHFNNSEHFNEFIPKRLRYE